MKCLLFGLTSLLLTCSQALAREEAPSTKGTTWKSGWGQMNSGELVSWRVADVKTGRMNWSFLIPGDHNSVTDDGYRYWSPGEINCKKGFYKTFIVFAADVDDLESLKDNVAKLASNFCDVYESGFKNSPYYK